MIRLLPVVVVLGALFLARPAHAFCRSTTCTGACDVDDQGCKTEGKPLAWGSSCVGVSLESGGTRMLPFADVEQALGVAMAAWSDVRCPNTLGPATISVVRLGDVDCARPEYDPSGPNANAIIFHEASWQYTEMENALGYTTVTFDTQTGRIFGADIELNAWDKTLTVDEKKPAYDLPSILTHEMGHLLGLAHSGDPSAVMFASYDEAEIRRVPSDDDVLAICAAYPPTRAATCDPTPANGFSPLCASATPAPEPKTGCGCTAAGAGGGCAAWLLVSALAITAAARRRRGAR